jgi:hypothetical protein
MAIGADFSIATNGDIRYTGSGTNYTVLEFHRWLQDLADDAVAGSDDFVDITDTTPSERATDNIITLLSPYNINDVAAEHLYDGSISQGSGAVLYSGLVVVGAVESGTQLQIIQNNQVLKNYWGTGLNADATQNILLRIMVKTRTGSADIDGKRLRVQARELSDRFAEFSLTAGSGNSTAAVFTSNDLNNATAEATIAGWTAISNTEGKRLLDVDNDTINEEYYSEWNRAAQTINQLYERTKWLQKRALSEAFNTETGTNYQLDSAGNTGFGQSFLVGANAKKVTRVRCRLKKVGSPTGNLTVKIYTHSGTFGTSSIPNASQATSENFDVATLTTSYQEVEIRFLGTSQFEMAAATHYVVTFEYSGGDGSNYVHVEGDATGTHAGNLSTNSGGWTATAGADLWFNVFASSKLYGMSGELFRGITHSWAYDTEASGPFTQNEIITWGTGATAGTAALLALDDDGATGNMYVQLLTGVIPTDPMTLTGATSGATAELNGAVTSRTVSPEYIGQSTGSALIGAYGIGVETADLSASDLLFDLTNTPRTPPNNVTFTVNGLVIGEDRVLVGPESGSTLQANQRLLNTTLSGAGETAVVVTVAIPSDTPSTGTIRIELDTGIYRRVAYTSFSGSTFQIASTDFTGANQATAGNDVFISYIDKLATATDETFTVVYSSARSLFIRVRDGGGTPIKTFETTGTLGSAGGSTTVIRTPDL